jgi:hypothetical protein
MRTIESMLSFEHYRLDVIEEWPAGPGRDAALKGVRSAIDSLLRAARDGAPAACQCIVCRCRRASAMPA